ncbi:MAG TPA: cupredoxin domain-containing protein [Acidimicrobiia bacterium]|nr:cupredoxin domain-containing protein [Acidimicrobiia bacterium]
MSARRTVVALLVPALFAAWAPVQAAAATCSPNGTALSITAFDSKFDKDCLAAPGGQAFTIEFSNLDRGIPHNVAIYEDESAAKTLFKGDLVDGPGKTTYSVEALTEGTFFFRCDPHPDMKGAFIVSGSA